MSSGLLALRSGAGLSLAIAHGWSKLGEAAGLYQGRDWGFVGLIRSMGFPFPTFFAVSAALSESIGAALVVCGLLTRVAGATVTITMSVAIYANLRDGTSIESAYLYAVSFLTLSLTGPGKLSLDHLLKRIRRQTGGVFKTE